MGYRFRKIWYRKKSLGIGFSQIFGPLNDDTKNLTETDTETFFPIPNFPKPIPRLFFRYQIFRNRYRDFFSDTKFSETDTETFFRYQMFRNRNPQKIGKSSKPKCQSLVCSTFHFRFLDEID